MATPRTSDGECGPAPLPPATAERSKRAVVAKTAHIDTGSVAPSLNEKHQELAAQQPGWTSTYLQKTTLLGFAVIFFSLLLAVIALAVVDAKQDGIANAKSNEHYLWTYGPTAVLVVIAAFWNQIEFRAKNAMPWMLLQKGYAPASEALLMDYVTPSKPEALITSLRLSHWPVAIAITNSFLITLLTVASTGLLVLEKTSFVRDSCRLNVTDDFVSSFDPATIGSASILATIAIQNESIPFPPGTSREAAFQTLLPPASLSGFEDVQVEGLTRSFHAGLECEIATVKSGASGCSDRQCHSLNVTIDITSPTCEIRGYNLTYSCGLQLDAISCDLNTAWGVGCEDHIDGHDTNRLVFMVGQMYQDLGRASQNGTEPVQILSNQTTTIVCEPKYNITNTYVTMDEVGNLKDTTQESATTNRTQQFPAWDLVDGLRVASDAAGPVVNSSYSYSSTSFFPWYTFHTLLMSWVDIAHPSSDLRDPSVLQARANDLFSMATAQMAKQSLMRPSADLIVGTCYGSQDRLRVRGLSLYLMGAVLVLLMLSSIFLLYIAPRKYTSRDPSSIGGLALVLSQSPALLSQLSSSSSADLKAIKHHLDGIECRTILTQGRLEVDLNLEENLARPDTVLDTEDASPAISYWRPLSLRPVFKALVIAALLVLVVVLEVLYSVSQKQNGLTEVKPQSYERFAWAYVPAIVMLTAQTLVGMIAFSSLMIFPYFRLRKRSSNTRSDMLRNYVSETAVKCLWQSIIAKHLVVMCMAVAMLLTPLLTIAVSGLYTAHTTSVDIPVTISVRNQFNSSFLPKDISMVGNPIFKASANNIGLLLTQNYTFPLWTYDEFAFPEAVLELPPTMKLNSSVLPGSNLTTRLPGIRSSLNCSVAPSVPTNFTDTIGGFAYHKANISMFEAEGVYDDNDNLPWPSPGMHPFGFFTLCSSDGYETMGNQFCGAFGTSEVNWNAFVCSGIIYELDVEITTEASTLAIIAVKPDESTSRLFSNQSLSSARAIDWPSSTVPSLFGSANFAGATAGFYDPMFQAVIYELGVRHDLDTFPMSDYMSNEGFDKITAQLQHVHRTIVAQSADLIRVPLNSTAPLSPPPTVNATLHNPHIYRLQQSGVSTRILDGLLIAIAICIALSFGLMDTRKILPKNPASIAAGASLFGGDPQMLQRNVLPEGAQWHSDAELKAKKVWEGMFFRLGWWSSEGPSEQARQGAYLKIDSV